MHRLATRLYNDQPHYGPTARKTGNNDRGPRRPAATLGQRIRLCSASGLAFTVALAVALLSSEGVLAAPVKAASGCSNVEVVFARGTNEPPGLGDVGQAFVSALTTRLPQESIGVHAVEYPASYDFNAALEGVIDASNRLTTLTETCPETRVVLGGYSQGAAVAGYTLTDALPTGVALPPGLAGPLPPTVDPHIAAVVMFGTPKPGVIRLLAGLAPPMSIAAAYVPRTLQLCAPRDPICTTGLDRKAHRAYLDNGMIDQAADFAARTI